MRNDWTFPAEEASVLPDRHEARMMDRSLHELARRLFTVATGILEDATQIGTAGQSSKLAERSCETYARELQIIGQNIAILAEAAALMARLSRQNGNRRLQKSR